MRMTRKLAIVASLAFATACASQPTEEPPLDPAPPEGGQQLATATYTLKPGQEIYMCYQFRSPETVVAITHLQSIEMLGVHHISLFQAFGHTEPEQPHECETLVKPTWQPIWVSGTGSHELALPAGTGFPIQPSTQYIMQLHLQNASDKPLDVRAAMNLTYDHDPMSLQQAGIFGIGSFTLDIPPATSDFQNKLADCAPGSMNVFAVMPHMHKIGTKLEVTRTTPTDTTPQPFYTIDPWTFGDQPMDPLTTTLTHDDTLHVTCHYNNPNASAVHYGESSDEEMCFFVLFVYPMDGADGCITG